MSLNILGLIPARGGSKGVPRKNKRFVGGKPLIQYSIDTALASNQITHVAVSTDDDDILNIAKQSSILAIKRPTSIAEDESPVIDAIRHALDFIYQEKNIKFDCIVLLQPTTPLRLPIDIDNTIELFFQNNLNPVCSVCQCEDNHPARMYEINDGKLSSLMPELATIRRQDLPSVYHRNGALYVFGPHEVETGIIINNQMTPYIMGNESSINIDTELDMMLLETMLSKL